MFRIQIGFSLGILVLLRCLWWQGGLTSWSQCKQKEEFLIKRLCLGGMCGRRTASVGRNWNQIKRLAGPASAQRRAHCPKSVWSVIMHSCYCSEPLPATVPTQTLHRAAVREA